MVTIEINEEQPLPCPKCKDFEGYHYSDQMRINFTSYHNPDGAYNGGEFTSGRQVNRAVTAYCNNCLTRLPFKLIRKPGESVSL